MKIANKQELQQIAFNSSTYIDFRKLKKKKIINILQKIFTKNVLQYHIVSQ